LEKGLLAVRLGEQYPSSASAIKVQAADLLALYPVREREKV
jgi:hypothetical protein